MACGPTFGISVDDLAAGEHAGQERLASRRAFRHPAARRPPPPLLSSEFEGPTASALVQTAAEATNQATTGGGFR